MGSEQRNAVLAVVLSGIILFGWQYYFAPKQAAPGPIEPTTTSTETTSTSKAEIQPTTGPIEPAVAQVFTIEENQFAISFDETLTIKDIKNPQAAFSFENTVGAKKPMSLQFDFGQGYQSLAFAQTEPKKFYNALNDVTVITSVDDKGVVSFNAISSKDFKYRFNFSSEPKKLENGQQRFFAVYTDELNHLDIADEESKDMPVKWAGVDFNYHLFGMYFDKQINLITKTDLQNNLTLLSNKAEKTLSFNLVFVKKEYNYLSSLGNNLKGAVDFGIWGIFAELILRGLQYFYTWFPNYGISIILLTFLIRIVTFPLQYKSIVSMKKLQLVQPELTKLREKYKDDPARMQKESMELFKRSGANPLGGCLPLLLQMPVFFAFYKVLYSAVELVDAPFYGWLTDLSNKDPYYVLPVLMTGAMFLQQKTTPNTITDPVQRKMMMFMPLIFGFIMKDMPSGLSLYIFVSTLLAILQQVFVFNAKQSNKPVVV